MIFLLALEPIISMMKMSVSVFITNLGNLFVQICTSDMRILMCLTKTVELNCKCKRQQP